MKVDFITENILASAATNGHVIIWDLNKPSKSKQGKENIQNSRKKLAHTPLIIVNS